MSIKNLAEELQSKGSVLYVEDDFSTRDAISFMLEHSGYNVLPYASPDDAMREIENGLNYDVGLIDKSFEGQRMDGDDLIKYSKQLYPKIPMISFSGYKERSPFTDYILQKPARRPQIIEALELSLGESRK